MTGMVRPTEHGAFLRPTIIDGLEPLSRTSTEEASSDLSSPFTDSILMKRPLRLQIQRNMDLQARWSRDTQRAHALAQNIETGIIRVNT